jgi:glycine cleavage system regulatory protein
MTTNLVLTFVGRDRPGIVNAISGKVAAAGGAWLESRLARLAGEFAGIVLVSVPETNIATLDLGLRDLEAKGLRVTLERSEGVPIPRPEKTYRLDMIGIEDFTSGVESAPFSGQEMFRASAVLHAPEGLEPEALQKTLERLAGEILVDLTFGAGG